MLGFGFRLLFRRPAFSARASRASTTIHDRSKRNPVSVSAAFATAMPAQLFTGYTVRSTTVVEDIAIGGGSGREDASERGAVRARCATL